MKNLYEEITKRIVEQLERGVVPWKSPYFSKIGFPRNFVSQKEYRGINVLLLASQRFTSPYFLTFLQARELGGNVKRGEKGYLVVKFGTYSKESDQGQDPSRESDEGASKRGFLKAYTVFNSSQIEGIDFPPDEALPELTLTEKTELARSIVEAMPNRPEIKEGSAVPCYNPRSDSVEMPAKDYFLTEESYYVTVFHELAHSTGHVSRLGRKSMTDHDGIESHGDTRIQAYAEEELVAEMAATFLSAHAGIEEGEIENSTSYIKSWADALKKKEASSWIVRAASEGQKASDYILGRS